MPRWSVPTTNGDIVVTADTEEQAAEIARTNLALGSVGVGAHGNDRPRMAPMTPQGVLGNAVVQGVTAAGRAGSDLAHRMTGREATQVRSSNPIVDALIGFPEGAARSVASMAADASSGDSMASAAQSTVNRTLPVVEGAIRHRPQAETSRIIRRSEDARRASGRVSGSETADPLISALTSDYQPSTTAGAISQRAGAAAPFLAAPGAVGPTIAGFGGGEIARGIAAMFGGNEDVQNAAGLGGNAAAAAAFTPLVGLRPSERIIRDRTALLNMTDDPNSHLSLATELQRTAQNLPNGGVRLYPDEALAQVGETRAAPLQALARQASRAPGGQAQAAEQMGGRAGEVQAVTRGTADMIAPPIEDPAALGVRAQRGATSALESTRAATNAPARASYDALETQLLPGSEYATLHANPSYRAALETVLGDPELAPLIQGLPQNSLSVINRVVQQLDTMEAAARESPTNPGGNNTLANQRADARTLANNAAAAHSPDWVNARSIIAQGRAGVLEPQQAGPLGTISRGQPNAGQAASALYPSTPIEGQAANTVNALRELGTAEPGVSADLTRLHLIDALDQGTRRIQGGPNPRGGANVANRLAGNQAAGDTFRAGVGEVAPQAAQTVDDLIRVLQATGTRSPEGSQTATDTGQLTSLGAGEAPMEAAKFIASPTRAPQRIDNWLQDRQLNANAGEIMRVLGLGPDEFAAYMRGLPGGAARNRVLGLAKALIAGQYGQGAQDGNAR